jgi:cytoskeletal protein CcmA (bactofilin family)
LVPPELHLDTAADAAAPVREADFLASVPVLRTTLGPDTSVSGRLSFTTPTRIDGTLRGEVRASDVLVIGETGFVDGTIRATNLIILGQVWGDVIGAERVEIGPKGTLNGTIETRALIVQEGGQLEGDCRIAPARSNVHVLHPRSEASANSRGAPD